uniref:DUF834 domain-containing protein n=1 Tax=Oryza meridionalis TaxID=40149 RepID=A0A0E0E7Z1_9ORYZ
MACPLWKGGGAGYRGRGRRDGELEEGGGVAEVKGGGGGGAGGGEYATATTKMIQMRPVRLGIARARPGGDRLDGIEDDIDEVKDPGEDQAVHQPMLPVLVRGSAPEKSDLVRLLVLFREDLGWVY